MIESILFLGSGRGSNFQAILDHIKLGILRNVNVKGVISNHAEAKILDIARVEGIRGIAIEGVVGRRYASIEEREKARFLFDKKWVAIAEQLEVNIVVLAGFDQVITPSVIHSLSFPLINIHPAYDLISFGGKNMVGRRIHEKVLKSGAKHSGCTVHVVSGEIDLGAPIVKRRVGVLTGDTPETLEERILQEEHLAYPEALGLMAEDRVVISEDRKRCFVDRYSDNWDLEWQNRQKAYIEFRQRLKTK